MVMHQIIILLLLLLSLQWLSSFHIPKLNRRIDIIGNSIDGNLQRLPSTSLNSNSYGHDNNFVKVSRKLRRCLTICSIACGTFLGAYNSNGQFNFFPINSNAVESTDVTPNSNYKLFDEVWNIVNENFFDDTYNHNDWAQVRKEYLQRLNDGADEGKLTRNMLTLLGDKYTRILDKSTYESLWKYDAIGIGALFQSDSGKRMYIAAPPLSDSSAGKAGLKKGDEIFSINGKSTDGMTAISLLDMMSNDNSDSITIEYARPETVPVITNTIEDSTADTSAKEKRIPTTTVVLQRTKQEVPNPVSYSTQKQSDGKLAGYIKLNDFNSAAVPGMQTALNDLNSQGVEEIALDLRGNTGGGFQFALNIGGMFMRNKLMVTAAGKGNSQNAFRSSYEQGVQYRMPLVVLTDGLSASASEVLTGGLRDNCRAVVAGDRTFGKGKIQAVFGLSSGEGLTMTVAQYITPKGSIIQGRGITPDLKLNTINPYINALVGNKLTQPDLQKIDFEAAEDIIRQTCTQEYLEQTRQNVAPML